MSSSKEEFIERIFNISSPWYVDAVKEDLNKNEVNIYLRYPRGTKFNCPECGKECSIYNSRERAWRDMDLRNFKTYIYAKVPKIKCCGMTPTITPPWAREYSHFTLLMEDNILKLCKMSTISKVADYLDEHDTVIWRIILHYVNKCREKADFSNVTNIGIDETSKKGQKYITSFVNLDTRRVMFVADGKDHTTIHKFVEDFRNHGGVPENIKNVTSDMSLAFDKGINECFVNATIIIDKFHVIKHLNEAINKVRIAEAKDNPLLKKLSIYG